MTSALSEYLDTIRNNLRLDFISEREILSELQTHIEDKLEEMREAGLPEEEAVSTCLKLLGSAKQLARQIYEAHSQGTWKQALWASMPHLLFGLMLVLNWWRGISWLAAMLGLVLIITIYGWRCGKPVWVFPWLGYSLLPVVVAGLFLLYLPAGWFWLAILIYIPLALWLILSVTIQTIRRDWLYTALMLLPIPIIIGWFLAMEPVGMLLEISLEHLHYFAPWVGLSFLALAVTTVTFIRLRKRGLKIALLHVSGQLTLAMVIFYAGGKFSLSLFLILALTTLGLLLSLALIERWVRRPRLQLKA